MTSALERYPCMFAGLSLAAGDSAIPQIRIAGRWLERFLGSATGWRPRMVRV